MINVQCFTVGEFQQNCRLIIDQVSSAAVMIDPGTDVAELHKAFVKSGAKSLEIWLTHSHIDHCGAVQELKRLTGAKLFAHQAEEFFRQNIAALASRYGFPHGRYLNCPEPDIFLEGGETLSIGAHKAKVFFTPGHSPGHLCYYFPDAKAIFAGDLVFQGSVGRTDLPGGDSQTLMQSISEHFLTLPDDVVVYSGHGPDTTVGAERVSNPFLEDLR